MIKEAVLAGGCFWGLEELFRALPGVVEVDVGYAGGDNDSPTYNNHPGHAEALCVWYDTTRTSYRELLDFFFRIHDPTTLNRQGNDVGTSYRSAIFYADDLELAVAKDFIEVVNNSGRWPELVMTSLEPLTRFYRAEDYHQDYLQKHLDGYTCHFVRGGSYL